MTFDDFKNMFTKNENESRKNEIEELKAQVEKLTQAFEVIAKHIQPANENKEDTKTLENKENIENKTLNDPLGQALQDQETTKEEPQSKPENKESEVDSKLAELKKIQADIDQKTAYLLGGIPSGQSTGTFSAQKSKDDQALESLYQMVG